MFLELLQLPFVQRAIIAGVLLGLLYAILGVHVILRNMAFWGDGIAHASLAGIALALIAGLNPLIMAIIIAIAFAIGVYFLERHTSLSNDALIGVLFTSFMALGIIILNLSKGYQPELLSFLFGNILTVTVHDLVVMSLVTAVVFGLLTIYNKQLTLLTFDRELAYLSGVKTTALDLVFYSILAVAVVLGVKVLGVILVSALLIIPASTAKLIARSFARMKYISVLVALLVVLLGMAFSLIYDIPSGPAIILMGAVAFLTASVMNMSRLRK